MRHSSNKEISGIVKNGFDYKLQTWIKDWIIQPCGHKDICKCFGKQYQGQDIRDLIELVREGFGII